MPLFKASGARRGETQLENSILNLEHGKHLRRKVQRSVIVSNVVICHALIPHSDNVLLGTVDGAIFTFDQVQQPMSVKSRVLELTSGGE